MTLDDIDRRIIGELQVDGRKALHADGAGGRSVRGGSAPARAATDRLRASCRSSAVTDPKVLGFSRQAMIGIQVEGDALAVADAVAALSEVEYVVLTAGGVDLLVEVVVEDDESLLELLNEQIRKIPGVRDGPRPTCTSASTRRRTSGARRAPEP